ncbi:alpha/beta fold hydrolase [Agromyces archimandritae]|uniref:Alpha/beta hydrolase n=1 Tax=Agromyces archimandritae TaxID=2781962 RepID=A0A975FP78_9MICO|nr:alpha/beta hydrolase [Agromyces archimandritae]QTX05113.1 alpha/beta hydrolase [Agromyces archimandritae]
MTLLPGIRSRRVAAARLEANVLEREAPAGAPAVVFVHGNVSSSLFWQPLMLALPSGIRPLAIDLRGFGDSETLPVDATRGVRDFSDDVASVLDALGLGRVHLVGWSMGGGVAMQLLIDRPESVASLTLQAPVSPYGYGATDAAGRLVTPDAAGTGGGAASAEFVRRLAAGDRSADAGSPRQVFRASYVAAGFDDGLEDLWVESMLTTKTGEGNYPGDASGSAHWPGFAPGARGVLNTMSPRYFDTSGIAAVDPKPPVLWIHGADDVIVGEPAAGDVNRLGELGAIPGWPGADAAPPQPMLTQTRAVLDRYACAGGHVTELELAHCGHSPHLEHPEAFREALLELLARADRAAPDPVP